MTNESILNATDTVWVMGNTSDRFHIWEFPNRFLCGLFSNRYIELLNFPITHSE